LTKLVQELLLYTNIDQALMNSLHRLLNCEIDGLECRVITTEGRTRVHCIQTLTRHSWIHYTDCWIVKQMG